MKKLIVITSIVSVILVFITSFSIIKIMDNQKKSSYKTKENKIAFELNDINYNKLEINTNYEEKGAFVKINNKEFNNDIVIDTSKLDNTKKGIYYISYKYKVNDYKTLTKYRIINVVDTKAPEITLKGSDTERVELGSTYTDKGVEVKDNSNEDLKDKVKVTGEVNTKKAGTYEIKYEVADSSNNKAEKIRKVIVYKKVTIVKVANIADEKGTSDKPFNSNNYNNTVTKMRFTNTGFTVEGFYKNYNGNFQMRIEGMGVNKTYNLSKVSNGNYKGTINITDLGNGVYNMYIVTNKSDPLRNELPMNNKIVRAKVGSKLVTMIYTNNNVSFKVEDHHYDYDILIDPGHGGSEPGAINTAKKEKDINLEQSLYEKKRYEEHGLKVLMVRTADVDGNVMGSTEWQVVSRRAYWMGYYGVVSRIMYSNHHNSYGNTTRSGWEIILPATMTKAELKTEYAIADEWAKEYPVQESHTRIYSRNYDTNALHSKANGEVYNYTNYYVVMRFPFDLYNVKNVLYEGAYMSNPSDFAWYYTEGNWKKLSEIKIKHYVESLGVPYRPPEN